MCHYIILERNVVIIWEIVLLCISYLYCCSFTLQHCTKLCASPFNLAGSEEEAHLPGLERLPTWAAALFSLIAVPVVVLIVVPLCVVVACARRKGKTGMQISSRL